MRPRSAPFFIVRHVPTSMAFYRDKHGFEITFEGPEPNDVFFAIVARGRVLRPTAGRPEGLRGFEIEDADGYLPF